MIQDRFGGAFFERAGDCEDGGVADTCVCDAEGDYGGGGEGVGAGGDAGTGFEGVSDCAQAARTGAVG